MIENIVSFVIELLPVAAGFVPAALYQLKFKKELSILYSISASLLIGVVWWWSVYNLKVTQESELMIMLLVMGSYLLLRLDDKSGARISE